MSDPIIVEVTTPPPIEVTVTEAVIILPGGGGGAVESVEGRTGVVTLGDLFAAIVHAHVVADVTGLQAALDAKQPAGSYAAAVHTHAQADVTGLTTALGLKAPLASPAFTGTPTGITKTHVGLGNVDNTSDANKPISTATATALSGKAATAHTHVIADTTGLQAALDAKAASSHGHVAGDISGLMADDLLKLSANFVVIGGGGASGSVFGEVEYAELATPDTIMYRGTGGRTKVGTPVVDAEATTKLYVDTAVAGAGGGTFTPPSFPGEYMLNAVRRGTANNSNGMTVGTLYCIPFYNAGPPMDIDRIAMNYSVAGAAGALIRLGAYEVGADGRIGDLLFDAGTIAADGATGDKNITITQTLPTGVTLLVAVANDNAIRPRWIGSTPTASDRWWRGKSGLLINSDSSLSYTGYTAASALPATGTTAGEVLIASDCLMIIVRSA